MVKNMKNSASKSTTDAAKISANVTLPYDRAEGRHPIGWYEYQIADDVRRFVPLYSEQDKAKARLFWQNDWDGEVD